jgi:hypothetical protein
MYSILFNVCVFWGPNPYYVTKYIAIDRLQLYFDYQKKFFTLDHIFMTTKKVLLNIFFLK